MMKSNKILQIFTIGLILELFANSSLFAQELEYKNGLYYKKDMLYSGTRY